VAIPPTKNTAAGKMACGFSALQEQLLFFVTSASYDNLQDQPMKISYVGLWMPCGCQ
jgi:hypothetical protein